MAHDEVWTMQCRCGHRFIVCTLGERALGECRPKCPGCRKPVSKVVRVEYEHQFTATPRIGEVIRDFDLPAFEP